jgi:hypothetical protein
MANRLEREFPRTNWRAMASIGPRGRERDILRRYAECGHKLRAQAIGRSAREAAAALAACPLSVGGAIRRGARGSIMTRQAERCVSLSRA